MNTNLPCPYCSSSVGFIYVQSHYQCLTCKRVVDDCCGGETMDCIGPLDTDLTTLTQNTQTSTSGFTEILKSDYSLIMRILSITPLALLCLALFSGSPVVADEYVMRCYDYKQHQTSFYKLVDTLINKKLFYRSLGEWREMCIDKYDTFYHKGDGAVCKTKVQDEKDRCKGTGT